MSVQPVTDNTERYLARFRALASNGAVAAPLWWRERRQEAIHRFGRLGFPTTRQEQWRFTSVKPIAEQDFALAPSGRTVPIEQLDPFFVPIDGAARLVFVDGSLAPDLSYLPSLPDGVVVQGLAAALAESGDLVERCMGRLPMVDDNPFAALNTAFAADGAFVYIPDGTTVEQPIQLLFFATPGDKPVMSHPRNLVWLGQGAKASVIETYAGTPGSVYLTNALTEATVSPNARLDVYRIQRESEAAYHIATTVSRQERGSRYSLTPVVLGAAISRHDVWMGLEGEGGEGTLNGLYVVGGRQHVDHSTVIDHAMPHCDSHEYFNGILDDHARAVFNGRIIVRPGAQKTDSKQTNNNLLLSKHARADSQPQLEIYADDVRCTHGATLGPLDDNALFYLRSRGMDAARARAMMTYGFGVEILNRVAIPELRAQLERLVKDRLREGKEQHAA